jgi:hypothetical protein
MEMKMKHGLAPIRADVGYDPIPTRLKPLLTSDLRRGEH